MSNSLASSSASDLAPFTPEELRETLAGSRNPEETLYKLVRAIQQRLKTDVCSVYLLEQNRSHLLMAATVGLRGECVGRVRMALHEGLAGMVA